MLKTISDEPKEEKKKEEKKAESEDEDMGFGKLKFLKYHRKILQIHYGIFSYFRPF